MKPQDLLGNELSTGDVIVIRPDHVVAVITAIETGDIVRGVSLAGPKPEGQQIQPHIVLRVEMSTVQGIMPNGLVPGVIKVQKPEQATVTG